MPGYLFFAKDDSKKRPLIILNQGFDATAEDSYFFSGAENPVELMQKNRAYHLRDVVGKIDTEMLVVDSEDESMFKGQAGELYNKLKCPKTFLMFKSEDGAGLHCQIFSLSNKFFFKRFFF